MKVMLVGRIVLQGPDDRAPTGRAALPASDSHELQRFAPLPSHKGFCAAYGADVSQRAGAYEAILVVMGAAQGDVGAPRRGLPCLVAGVAATQARHQRAGNA